MVTVGIVGVNGYGGGELLRLLAEHPAVEVKAVASRSHAGKRVTEVFPSFWGYKYAEMTILPPDSPALSECNVVFLAVPHGVAAEMAPGLLGKGVKVIDLGADFRFKRVDIYEAWYKLKHSSPDLIPEAVYGLPELKRERISGARLVGNPGCYPTSILLGIAPLLKSGLVTTDLIIADSKSGVSGAGRSVRDELHYAEVEGGFRAYGLVNHRHTPEIEEIATWLAGREMKVSFTPHLAPMVRGIFSTIHIAGGKNSTAELTELYQDFYRDEPFITVLPEPYLPQTKGVLFTNRCHLGVRVDARTGQIIILSVIDNLVKGAAGQAVQNMNLICGLEETLGLTAPGIWP